MMNSGVQRPYRLIKPSLVEILKVQSKRHELEAQQDILDEQYAAQQVALNTLLNRDIRTHITFTQDLSISEADDHLAKTKLAAHPELRRYDHLLASTRRRHVLDQKARRPRFGLGIHYAIVDGRQRVNTLESGKDVLMPTLSFSVPIFNKKYASLAVQNQLKKQYILYQKEEHMQAINTALYQAIHTRNAAKIDLSFAGEESQTIAVHRIITFKRL